MSRRRNVMLDIAPPVIQRTTRGLDNFSLDDDSDSDREDPLINPFYGDLRMKFTMMRPFTQCQDPRTCK
jgi:hypothetical protein